jgi:hypothetical protein
MGTRRETLSAIAIDGLGFVAGIATFLALYGHLWLGAFDDSAGELPVVLSGSVAAERSAMETLRLGGAVATVVALGLLVAAIRIHESALDAPRQQMRRGVVIALLMCLAGGVLYVFVSDVIVEALGLTLLGYGLLLAGVGLLSLVGAESGWTRQ